VPDHAKKQNVSSVQSLLVIGVHGSNLYFGRFSTCYVYDRFILVIHARSLSELLVSEMISAESVAGPRFTNMPDGLDGCGDLERPS
jgi:hypothetical protein